MTRFYTFISLLIIASATLLAADPTETSYSFEMCEGSAMPYPAPAHPTLLPDSLEPVFINHVGRHGARFPSSARTTNDLIAILQRADSAKALSPSGVRMLGIVRYVAKTANGRWGALDSLGMAEQRGIASRMFNDFRPLFTNGRINAISSYSPRCVMSMYEFTHQLDRLDNRLEIFTSSGRQNSPLMRFFDLDPEMQQYLKEGTWKQPWDMQFETMMPSAPARKLFKGDYAKEIDTHHAQEITYKMFSLLQGLPAMGLNSAMPEFFTKAEANAAWSCTNLRHYLQRSATTLTLLPAENAAPLLIDLLSTTAEAAEGKSRYVAMLRFGHAETLMPLLALMRLKGCYYLTNYFDTAAMHWCDFHIVPMASNFRIILARTKAGRLYFRCDLNEVPIPLLPNSDAIYIPWAQAEEYLLRCLPLHLRP